MLVTVLPGVWTGVAISRICRKLRRILSRNILAILLDENEKIVVIGLTINSGCLLIQYLAPVAVLYVGGGVYFGGGSANVTGLGDGERERDLADRRLSRPSR